MLKRMVRVMLAAVLLCAVVLVPVSSSTEDTETTMLAQTLYAMAGEESYDTQIAIGSVILNRVTNDAFPDTLAGVLDGGFPRSETFDGAALQAARDCLSGARSMPGYVLYLKRENSGECWNSSGFFRQEGEYQFFMTI